MRAAERLFAEQGIHAVSLREVNRVAGQANTAAVQYYFGDRVGLVQAILTRHRADSEIRRHALLDQYEQAGEEHLRALSAAFVSPLVAKLGDPDGGREYLRIAAEYYSRPAPFDGLVSQGPHNSSMARWNRLLDPLMPPEERSLLHSRFPAIRFGLYELARRAAAPPHRDDQLFASHLIDLVMAVLASTPSAPTGRLLERRSSQRDRD
jgi:AcrR family transcriptional regulator